MKNEKCGNCKFYDDGDCRRFPPAPVFDTMDIIFKFPRLPSNKWCGEFEDASNRSANG